METFQASKAMLTPDMVKKYFKPKGNMIFILFYIAQNLNGLSQKSTFGRSFIHII